MSARMGLGGDSADAVTRPAAPTSTRMVVAAALVAPICIAVLMLPTQQTAEWLAAGGRARVALLVPGLALLKVSVVALGIAVLMVARAWPGPASGAPLFARPDADGGTAAAWTAPTLAALLALALALRLAGLNEGLWSDEIHTLVDFVRLPFHGALSTFDSQNQHLLYTLAAKLVVGVAGESAWAVRLPAVLFGVASVAAAYAFARPVVGRLEAMLVAAGLTVVYHHIWFSQSARGYTALLLFTLLSSFCFLRLFSSPAGTPVGGAIVAYAASIALALFTHATAAVLPAAHVVVAAALLWRTRADARAWRVAGAAFGLAALFTLVLYAVVVPQVIATTTAPTLEGTAIEWKRPGWLLAETVRSMAEAIPGGSVLLALALTVFGVGIADLWRRSRVACAIMLLPVAFTAAAIIGLGHNLWPRFFFFAAAFILLIAARGGVWIAERIAHARGASLARIAIAAVCAAAALLAPRAWAPKQDFASAKRFVEERRAEGDAVFTVDMTVYPLRAYYGATWDSVATLDDLRAAESRHDRTFVLYTFPVRLAALKPDVWAHLQARYRTEAVFPASVRGADIVVAVADRGAPTR